MAPLPVLWNEAVHQQRSGGRPTFLKLSKNLTEARSRTKWLRDGAQVVQQQTLRVYSSALQESYRVRGRGRPTVKKRKTSRPSLEYTRRSFDIRNDKLCLSKCPVISVVWSRNLPSEPSSVRVYRDSIGHWYASFVVKRKCEDFPISCGEVGIDWGVSVTATASKPEYDLPYHGFRKRCAAELAKAQRKMSRRRRLAGCSQSVRYSTARRQAAKLHKKAARQNVHYARQWARKVVINNTVIAIEDFKPKFLSRSNFAYKAADAAIGIAKRELIERAQQAGRKVVLVPPAYTTMTCSSCLAINKRLELGQRIFRCEYCGLTADRDRNSARVILATVEPDRVSADDVSHPFLSLDAV